MSLKALLGLILFNLSTNDLLFFASIASAYNFTDDNMLSAFVDNISKVINIEESEYEDIIDWLKKNEMTVKLDKFK